MYIHITRPKNVPSIIQSKSLYSLAELMRLKLNTEDFKSYFNEFVEKFGDEINPSAYAKSDTSSIISEYVWLYPAEDDNLWCDVIASERLKRLDEFNPVKFVFSDRVEQRSGVIKSSLFIGIMSKLELDDSSLSIIIPRKSIYEQILEQIHDPNSRKYFEDKAVYTKFVFPFLPKSLYARLYAIETKRVLKRFQSV